jgi:SAM-dependent methyltransferase
VNGKQDKNQEAVSGAQARITAFWDAVSDAYDRERGNVPRPGSREESAWIEALGRLLPDPPARVIDVGTGTGFVARIAALRGHPVVGIDLSEKMLDVARLRARDSQVVITFLRGDAVAPAFPAGSFDALTNRSLIWTLLELDQALIAWRSLLRSGGRLICVYGLVEPRASDSTSSLRPRHRSRGAFFDQYYPPETQDLLAASELSEHQTLIDAVTAAGFASPEVHVLDVNDPDEGTPLPANYALTATA